MDHFLLSIEKLIEKSFDTKSKRNQTTGILQRLGIDEEVCPPGHSISITISIAFYLNSANPSSSPHPHHHSHHSHHSHHHHTSHPTPPPTSSTTHHSHTSGTTSTTSNFQSWSSALEKYFQRNNSKPNNSNCGSDKSNSYLQIEAVAPSPLADKIDRPESVSAVSLTNNSRSSREESSEF